MIRVLDGEPAARRFCSSKNTAQPSDRRGRLRSPQCGLGRLSVQEDEGSTPRRAELAARPSAVGPRAQAGADHPDPGRKAVWAARTVTITLRISSLFRSIFLLFCE